MNVGKLRSIYPVSMMDGFRALGLARGAAVPPAVLASPWTPTPTHLQSVVLADIFGGEARPLTRGDAMLVPAVARARRLIAATIARIPLIAEDANGPLATQPIWLTRTDGNGQTPYHRLLWTIDDLLFYGWSCWILTRSADGSVARAQRVDWERWGFNLHGEVEIYGIDGRLTEVDRTEVCLIPGVDEGLLAFGGPAIKHARALIRNADRAATHSTAFVNLKQTNDAELTSEQIHAVQDQWITARKGERAGVSFTPRGIEVEEMGAAAEQLLIEGRNAAAVDIARVTGIPAALIDAGGGDGSSITYANANSRNLEFVDYSLAPWIGAVCARLGMDDMVPRGTRITADLSEFTAVSSAAVTVPDDATPAAPAPAAPAPSEVP